MPNGAKPDPSLGSPAKQCGSQSDSDRYKVVSIRLRRAEFESFSERATSLGLTSNLALRIAARRIGGFLEIDRDVRKLLEEIMWAIGEVSRNIGNLHADYAESGDIDLNILAAQRIAFGQEFAHLDALLRSILNVTRRRSDGVRMLEDAMK